MHIHTFLSLYNKETTRVKWTILFSLLHINVTGIHPNTNKCRELGPTFYSTHLNILRGNSRKEAKQEKKTNKHKNENGFIEINVNFPFWFVCVVAYLYHAWSISTASHTNSKIGLQPNEMMWTFRQGTHIN